MRIRIYSKQELALMYFPGSKPHTAVNRLMRWIGRCGQLRSALEAAHYYPHSRHFTDALEKLNVGDQLVTKLSSGVIHSTITALQKSK